MGHPLCLKFIVFCLVLRAAFRSQEGDTHCLLPYWSNDLWILCYFLVCFKARFGVIFQTWNWDLAVLGLGEKMDMWGASGAERLAHP